LAVIDATLVTIHGFWSSPATWEPLNEVWRADEELRGMRTHPFGYPSPKKPRLPFSVTRVPDYDDIAQTLATEYATVLADVSDIAIVTHSQGGLVIQRFLAWMVSEGRARELSRIRSVVMLACPNGGSEYLDSLRRALGYGRHPQAGRLHVLDRQVSDTQRTVLQRIVNAVDVDDYQCRIPFHVYAGGSDDIVKAASAQATFPGASTLAGDHFTILDPAAPGNRTAEIVKRHIVADITAPRVHPGAVPAPEITGEPEPPATDERTSAAKYMVNAYDLQGLQIGDHDVQRNVLPEDHAEPLAAGRVGLQPESSISVPLGLPNYSDGDESPIHNLGPRHDLIGRTQDIQAALRRLSGLKQPLILVGPPGIGKSSLAIESAYRLLSPNKTDPPFQPYECILFFTARLKSIELTALLDELARWTGNVYIMKLSEVTQKLIEVHKLLSRTRMLLIFDNLESVHDPSVFEFIESVPFPSQLLGTSRRRHSELAFVSYIELPAISSKSSGQLLQRELGDMPGQSAWLETARKKTASEISKLESMTSGNPLAIKWVAAQLRAIPIDSLIASLEAARGDLFSNMFDSTWSRLSDEAQAVLVVITFFKTPPTVRTAISVAHVQPDSERVLTELSASSLVESSYSGLGLGNASITLHPLTQAFAAAKFVAFTDGRRKEIEDNYIDHYETIIKNTGGRDWDDPKPFKVIDEERDNYVQAVSLAEAEHRWASVVAIVDGLRNYLLIYGYWSLRLQLCQQALRAAEELNDHRVRAQFIRHIGWTMVLQGHLAEAATNLEMARDIAIREGDLKVEADATGDLAEIARLRSDFLLARNLRSESLRLSRLGGDQRDIYVEQTLLAQMDLDERRLEAAREGFQTSIELARQLRWHRAIAYCLHWLGEVARLQGDYRAAHRYLSQSRGYLGPFHDRARLALILKSEALLVAAEGDIVRAQALAREAMGELTRLGLPYELQDLESLTNAPDTADLGE
jgi:hypothetical protein